MLLLFWCSEKKGTLTKLSFITSFIQQTPRGHLAKKTNFLVTASEAIELPNTSNTNMADPCTFTAFANILFSTTSYSLSNCCSSATYSFSHSTAFSYTSFCPVLQARFLPLLSPLRPQPFVDACIATRTSLRAMLFKATLHFGFDLLWLRECVMVLFLSACPHTWEVGSSGTLQLPVTVNTERMKHGSVCLYHTPHIWAY